MSEGHKHEKAPKAPASGNIYKKIDGISTRGETLSGKIVSDKMKHTVIVERGVTKYFPKYRKYARTSSRIVAHNPPSLNAKLGDMVTIAETRKLSKTKAWMVIEIVSRSGE